MELYTAQYDGVVRDDGDDGDGDDGRSRGGGSGDTHTRAVVAAALGPRCLPHIYTYTRPASSAHTHIQTYTHTQARRNSEALSRTPLAHRQQYGVRGIESGPIAVCAYGHGDGAVHLAARRTILRLTYIVFLVKGFQQSFGELGAIFLHRWVAHGRDILY